MTNLPALREAVATMGTCRCYGVEGCDACADNMYAILNALPALLDELEAARAENAALHQRPCPCCGATAEDYPATLETADHIAGLSNMVEDARERKGET